MSPDRKVNEDSSKVERGEENLFDAYAAETPRYPVLNVLQEAALFRYISSGRPMEELRQNSAFSGYFHEHSAYNYVFQTSDSLEDLALRCNLRLVLSEATDYRGEKSMSDLIREGSDGLKKAIKTYNPAFGRFAPFAQWWIKNSIDETGKQNMESANTPDRHETDDSTLPRRTRRFDVMVETIIGRNAQLTVSEITQQLEELGITISPEMVQKSISRLVESKLIEPREISPPVLEARMKTIDDFVLELLNQDSNLREKEIVQLLSDPGRLGRRVSLATVQRSLSRLAKLGAIEPMAADEFGRTRRTRNFDSMVHALINEDRRLTAEEISQRLAAPDKLGVKVASITAQRSISRLVRMGVIEPRRGGRPAITAKGKNLDDLVKELLQQDPNLRYKEIVQLLAEPDRLGRRVALLTVARSHRKLAEEGKVASRTMKLSAYRDLDKDVEELLQEGFTYKQVAQALGQPLVRVKSSGYRLRTEGRTESRTKSSDKREAIERYIKDHTGEKINLSEIGRQFGVTREWVRQIYSQITST